MTPPEVITGSTQFDRDIGFFEALKGKATDANGEPFRLFSDFYKVPIQDLINGYTFGSNDGRRQPRRRGPAHRRMGQQRQPVRGGHRSRRHHAVGRR